MSKIASLIRFGRAKRLTLGGVIGPEREGDFELYP